MPQLDPSVVALSGSPYSSLVRRVEIAYPLHIGDTWLPPALTPASLPDRDDLHRYAPTKGLPELRAALAERVAARQGVPTGVDHVLVSAGATGALAGVVGATVGVGDEVLILAPHWPLIAGMVHLFGGTPVRVPWFGAVRGPDAGVAALEARRTSRTRAVYLCTPSNPTGLVLTPDELGALVGFARRHDLWLYADEVYEDFDWGPVPHVHTRTLAPERTLSLHSASKAWGMSGHRVGYAVGPAEALRAAHVVTTHASYCAPAPSQALVHEVLRSGAGNAWVADALPRYREVGERAAARLGLPAPQGSAFLFVDVAHALDERGLQGFVEDCARDGLLVAPGTSFGPYPTHVRVSISAVRPELTLTGVEVLARHL